MYNKGILLHTKYDYNILLIFDQLTCFCEEDITPACVESALQIVTLNIQYSKKCFFMTTLVTLLPLC